MFELKINDIFEALKLSQQWATHTISLLDPDIERCDYLDFKLPVATEGRRLQRYYFHDITCPDDLVISLTEEQTPVLANRQQIQEILKFTAHLTSTDKLLVHCQAGCSRSPAVALGILCQHGLTPDEAMKYVLSIRPQAHPNEHVLTLFDEILELDGKLVAAGKSN